MELSHLIEDTGNTGRFMIHYEDLLPVLKMDQHSSMQEMRDYIQGLCGGNASSNVFSGRGQWRFRLDPHLV